MTENELAPAGTALMSSSLVELAVARLRREILSGAFAPGDRLVEEQITRRFGISRAPLREALRLLGEQHLVEHVPRRGARVATLTGNDVAELFEVRDVLERFAVGRALPGAGGRLERLARQLETMRLAATAGDDLARADAHRRFHVELVALAGQRQLLAVYEPILVRLQLHMALNLRRESERADAADGVRRHAVLLQAVRTDDPDAVLESLAGHGAQAYLP